MASVTKFYIVGYNRLFIVPVLIVVRCCAVLTMDNSKVLQLHVLHNLLLSNIVMLFLHR